MGRPAAAAIWCRLPVMLASHGCQYMWRPAAAAIRCRLPVMAASHGCQYMGRPAAAAIQCRLPVIVASTWGARPQQPSCAGCQSWLRVTTAAQPSVALRVLVAGVPLTSERMDRTASDEQRLRNITHVLASTPGRQGAARVPYVRHRDGREQRGPRRKEGRKEGEAVACGTPATTTRHIKIIGEALSTCCVTCPPQRAVTLTEGTGGRKRGRRTRTPLSAS